MTDIESASVSERLKSETLTNHTSTEDRLQPLLAGIRTHSDYAKVLKIFYGYFHPLSKQVRQFIDAGVIPDIDERRTTHLILRDLETLGTESGNISEATHLPKIDSLDQALGALYVMEGSTLGGRFITKMLLKNSSAQLSESQVNFFNGYGAETGKKWTSFKSVLDSKVTDAQGAIDAANETFALMQKWIEQNLANTTEPNGVGITNDDPDGSDFQTKGKEESSTKFTEVKNASATGLGAMGRNDEESPTGHNY